MASLNKVLLIGNLTRDPELRYTPNGTAVSSFGLAVNRKYKKDEEWVDDVLYVDIVSFGKQAENCTEYLSKGSPVFIEGRLQWRSWEGEDGQKRSKHEVVASSIQFLSKGKEEGSKETGRAGSNVVEDDVPF
jgi:single-strand DNA-binding protein